MLAIAGIVTVFLAVLGGYLLEHGNPYVLLQPAELLIVGGAAIGIVVVSTPPRVIRKMIHGAVKIVRAPGLTRPMLLRHLMMLYEVFSFVHRAGYPEFEQDVEHPKSSRIFSRYPEFLKDTALRDFLCDSLRMLVIGAANPSELDQLMDLDIEAQRRGGQEPAIALHAIAEALPGLGIVAAVLGVVITMESIGGTTEMIGQKVAAALVGTFLGILLCYGLVGPLAARLEGIVDERAQFLEIIRTALGAFARGSGPILAVEYARRSIPLELRPTFHDFETALKRDAKIPAAPDKPIPQAQMKETAGASAA